MYNSVFIYSDDISYWVRSPHDFLGDGVILMQIKCRGSVPIFWSQEINYQLRPPMKIDCSLEESLPYFQKHVKQLLGNYGSPLILLNLVDQEGKEKKLGESYFQVRIFFNKLIILVSFSYSII